MKDFKFSEEQKKSLIKISVAVVVLLAVLIFGRKDGVVGIILYAIPYIIVGGGVLWEAVENIFHGEPFDENLLMAVASLGAFAIGEYTEAVAVMLFYQIGELFEDVASEKSRRAVSELMDIRPDRACVLRDGRELIENPADVAAGETILVRPGERIPLDGTVVEGVSSLDTSALTGESVPVDVCIGSEVMSGAVNLEGVLKLVTSGTYAESTVARILELTENAASRKASTERFITRFARWYTPAVVGAAALVAVLPPLITGGAFSPWIHRALSFLVISCPCALVVSVPLAFFIGIGGAAKKGILIKGAAGIEALSEVDTVAFDKTGTLTEGGFRVREIISIKADTEEILHTAAALEAYSGHPLAKAVCETAGVGVKLPVEAVEELPGRGIKGIVAGKPAMAGNSALLKENGIAFPEYVKGGSVIYVVCDGELLGAIVLGDTIRPEAKPALADLAEQGVKRTVMLTGDREESAAEVAGELGLTDYSAALLPDGKLRMVESMISGGQGKVAFVGDGVNDAPVLACADVGIAMGGIGSDAAVEAADAVILSDRLTAVPGAIAASKHTMRIVRENISVSLAIKLAILILSIFGVGGMWPAVFADVGVLVLAILNSMRAGLVK